MQDMKEYRTPLSEKMADLDSKGYDTQFKFEDGVLKVRSSQKNYQAQELTINEEFRFEGESNPGDMSILYAVETKDGTKGTIVNAYGTYSDGDLGEFMSKVQEKGKTSDAQK